VGLVLCGLTLRPTGWLAWYSITDDSGRLTLGNFTRLAGDPSFALPYLTALGIACAVAAGAPGAAPPLAWLVARNNQPLSRAIRSLVSHSGFHTISTDPGAAGCADRNKPGRPAHFQTDKNRPILRKGGGRSSSTPYRMYLARKRRL